MTAPKETDPTLPAGLPPLNDTSSALQLLHQLDLVAADDHGRVTAHAVRHPQLLDRAVRTPLGDLEAFLVFVEHAKPLRPVFDALAADLGQAEHRSHLVDRALRTPLRDLEPFLAYIEHARPLRPLFNALAADLGQADRYAPLVERARITPLHFLSSFLDYVEHTVPLRPVFAALAADLGRADRSTPLVGRVLLTPLNLLPSFLAYLGASLPLRPVFDALVADLGQADRRAQLVDRALHTPLADLGSFLAYVQHAKPLRPIFDALAADLTLADRRAQLVDRALLSRLDDLASFLAYVEHAEPLRPVFDALATDLGQAERRAQLADRALLTPIDDLESFLAYVQDVKPLRPIFDALAADLGEADRRAQLVELFTAADLYHLVTILSAAGTRHVWAPVLSDVSTEEWQQRHSGDGAPDPEAFVRFQGLVTTLGRPELAVAPAAALVRSADPKRWHRLGIGIRHVSHVLGCARPADRDARRFLERIATPEWIDRQLDHTSTSALAGALQALSVAVSPGLRGFFLRPALRDRITREAVIPRQSTAEWVEIISLLGAAAACGLHLDALSASWPDAGDLESMVQVGAPESERTAIGRLQTELWLGLREMARLRPDVVGVPAEPGNRILSLWRAAQDVAHDPAVAIDVRDTNASMVAWLDGCRANGWSLVK